jgi:hypothetical protein
MGNDKGGHDNDDQASDEPASFGRRDESPSSVSNRSCRLPHDPDDSANRRCPKVVRTPLTAEARVAGSSEHADALHER